MSVSYSEFISVLRDIERAIVANSGGVDGEQASVNPGNLRELASEIGMITRAYELREIIAFHAGTRAIHKTLNAARALLNGQSATPLHFAVHEPWLTDDVHYRGDESILQESRENLHHLIYQIGAVRGGLDQYTTQLSTDGRLLSVRYKVSDGGGYDIVYDWRRNHVDLTAFSALDDFQFKVEGCGDGWLAINLLSPFWRFNKLITPPRKISHDLLMNTLKEHTRWCRNQGIVPVQWQDEQVFTITLANKESDLYKPPQRKAYVHWKGGLYNTGTVLTAEVEEVSLLECPTDKKPGELTELAWDELAWWVQRCIAYKLYIDAYHTVPMPSPEKVAMMSLLEPLKRAVGCGDTFTVSSAQR